MKLIIEISEDIYKTLKTVTNIVYGFRSGKTFVHACLTAIKNGIPLPKGHGRLIDADAFERRCMFDSDIEDMQDVIYALRDYKPIIGADNESEAAE